MGYVAYLFGPRSITLRDRRHVGSKAFSRGESGARGSQNYARSGGKLQLLALTKVSRSFEVFLRELLSQIKTLYAIITHEGKICYGAQSHNLIRFFTTMKRKEGDFKNVCGQDKGTKNATENTSALVICGH